MRRLLRDVREIIARGGGEAISITEGTRHTEVRFVAPGGAPQVVRVHHGTNPKRYAEALRSDLRRKGLRP